MILPKDHDSTPYILNNANQYITKEYIESMLSKFDIKIKVKHLDIFQTSMVHVSYLVRDDEYYRITKQKRMAIKELKPIKPHTNAIPLQKIPYERLEFLGDSVLHLVLASYLYHRYPNQDEGFYTTLRTKIENGQTLAELSKCIGLNKYIMLSRHIEENGGRENNMAALEDSFEAFMGVLYNEAGYDVCNKFFVKLMEREVDFALLLSIETNFKDRLLRYFHQMQWADPKYGTIDVTGQEHKKVFHMYIMRKKNRYDDGEIVARGLSSSKKGGEQEAAKNALIEFGVIHSDNSDSDDDFVEEITTESDSDTNNPYTTKKINNKIVYVCNKCNKLHKKINHIERHIQKCCDDK